MLKTTNTPLPSAAESAAGLWFLECLTKNGISGRFAFKDHVSKTANVLTESVKGLKLTPKPEVFDLFAYYNFKYEPSEKYASFNLAMDDLTFLHDFFEGEDCFGSELRGKLDSLRQESFEQLRTLYLLMFCQHIKAGKGSSFSEIAILLRDLVDKAIQEFRPDAEKFLKASYPEGLAENFVHLPKGPEAQTFKVESGSAGVLFTSAPLSTGSFSAHLKRAYFDEVFSAECMAGTLRAYPVGALLGGPLPAESLFTTILTCPPGVDANLFSQEILSLAEAHFKNIRTPFNQVTSAAKELSERIIAVHLAEESLLALNKF